MTLDNLCLDYTNTQYGVLREHMHFIKLCTYVQIIGGTIALKIFQIR